MTGPWPDDDFAADPHADLDPARAEAEDYAGPQTRSCQFHGAHLLDDPPCARPGESGMQYTDRMFGYTRDV